MPTVTRLGEQIASIRFGRPSELRGDRPTNSARRESLGAYNKPHVIRTASGVDNRLQQ